MVQTHDHEMVSIYPFTDEEVDALMANAHEAVLMWATKDGWPVGVTHAFFWRDGKIWLTFAEHRHRTAAIRRDPRVSVNVSTTSYRPDAPKDLPQGAITFKGTVEFFSDRCQRKSARTATTLRPISTTCWTHHCE
jgi:nitroimidazol reductase NimA-like FMN-containing flavoprotein (pyridoxamine 5'-phosphate oxidase superfamily)